MISFRLPLIYEKIWQIEIQYILGKTDIKANYDTILYQEHDEFDKLKKDIKNKIDDKLWNIKP